MTKRSTKIENAILDGVADGIPLAEQCDAHGIARKTFMRWTREDEGLARRFELARSQRCDALLEECLEIADDARNDWMERRRGEGPPVINLEHIRRSQVRIDTRLRLVAKWDPRRYGDAIQRTAPAGETPPSNGAPAAGLAARLAEGRALLPDDDD